MSRLKNKLLYFLFVLILLLSITTSVNAATNDKIILQKSEKEYIIYFKDICNNEFNYAFSLNKDTEKENLIFISSVKDDLQEEKLNVAYIDETIYNKYFKDNENKSYIWVKDSEGNFKIEGEEINLNNGIMSDSIIEFINTTTKRIKGEEVNNPDYAYKNIWTDGEGVKHTVVLSQFFIDIKEGNKYYFQLVKIPNGDTTTEASKLYNLAEKLKKGGMAKYEQFLTQLEFYNLFQELQPKAEDTNWLVTENGEIREPEDTITGDRYIIWLKSENGDEVIQDAKFLECYQEDKEEREKYTPIEVVKTPKTFDSKALLIVFGIIILLIVIVLVLRKNSTKTKYIPKH